MSLSHSYLLTRLHYDPNLGLFWWKPRNVENHFHRTWNLRFAGQIAGTWNTGYVQIKIDGQPYKAHRLAWFYTHGIWPIEVDHRNRNRGDNAMSNLREATNSENQGNKAGWGKTGLKGVSPNRNNGWVAGIRIDGRRRHLGTFPTKEEAQAAYLAAASDRFGEFASDGAPTLSSFSRASPG